ncbi:hypothetical protein [Nannocystis bainbridge]|uniref:Uncharacterized protein n=1 Tax=Nannocystis bainbridge TaxID=2995303 RepID=A0ABT5DXI5_9BACT|nr:hypothetical protein [Nannocystis bainbridge]MDC0718281.1 hypothetical protein [Nannocystis bainbridge]
MARTQHLAVAPAGPEAALNWWVSPLDGPQIVLLVLVVGCGLLGLAWRGQHRPPPA